MAAQRRVAHADGRGADGCMRLEMRLPRPAGRSDILRWGAVWSFAIPTGKGAGANESGCLRQVRAAGGPAARRGRAAGTQRGRGPRQGPRHDGQPDRLRGFARASRSSAASSAVSPGRGGRSSAPSWPARSRQPARPSPSSRSATRSSASMRGGSARTRSSSACGRAPPLARKPAGTSFEEAAAVCDGAILALDCLRPAELRKGKTILVYGASGSIGTAAVQLAKYFGADVTAVCNTKNVDARPVARRRPGHRLHPGGLHHERPDLRRHLRRGRQALVPALQGLTEAGAGCTSPPTDLQNLALALWTSRIGDKRVVFPIPPRYTKNDVLFLKQLIEAGKYRAVIDRCYPLEQVIEATRYVETEQKTGNVVLTVNSGRARSEAISHDRSTEP